MKTQFFITLAASMALSTLSYVSDASIAGAKFDDMALLPEPLILEAEQPLEIENWMINNTYWATETLDAEASELSLESWMIDNSLWENKQHTEPIKLSATGSDHNMDIESWMIDCKLWGKNSGGRATQKTAYESEKDLDIEPWMTDETQWNFRRRPISNDVL